MQEAGDVQASVKAYLDALNSSDPDAMRAALEHAAPRSVAHSYLQHQANVEEAALDGGQQRPEGTVVRSGDGYRMCSDQTEEKTCVMFTDFKSAGGKLSDLKVNGVDPGPLLTVGNGDTVKSKGATFEFLTAYRSVASNALFVALRVTSGPDPISPFLYDGTYRSPDGKQRKVTDAYGSTELDAKSNTVVAMVFAASRPGGKVTLEGCVADCTSNFTAVVQVG